MEFVIEVWNSLSLADALLIIGTPIWLTIYLRWYFKQRKNRKHYKKRIAELEEQKCDGPHSWIYMPIDGDSVNVCKECCWSPTHEGYIKRLHVDAEIKAKDFNDECEKHLKEKLEEYGVTQEMYDKLVNIKKDFALAYIDERMKEIAKDIALGE